MGTKNQIDLISRKISHDYVLTEFIKNVMTAWPPPKSNENSVPTIVTSTLRFCFTINQMESVTSNSVPMFVLIKLIKPCCAAEKSSLEYNFVFIYQKKRVDVKKNERVKL